MAAAVRISSLNGPPREAWRFVKKWIVGHEAWPAISRNCSFRARLATIRRPNKAWSRSGLRPHRRSHWQVRRQPRERLPPKRCQLVPRVPRLYRSEEHTSELQSHSDLVCRLLLEKKKKRKNERAHKPTYSD